ncbi:MAG: rod-binding protein [Proteobacteria bacterium]|nr:rod-binding protein [Pseudomonadota bacterium]MBU1649794.1 rod-binding protein [Pseudomonadota bacterium]
MALTIHSQNITEAVGTTARRPDSPPSKKLQSLRKSCREFEAIYTQEMYKAMRKTVPDSGLFEKDMSSELYKEMLDMEIAKASAAGKGNGIGEAMYQQMKDKVEHQK